jgi:hypothetical protein
MQPYHAILSPLPAAFKQQNAVHGLPLELADDEVTLAVERGWGVLRPLLGTLDLAQGEGGGGVAGGQSRKRGYRDMDDEDEDDFSDGSGDPDEAGGDPAPPLPWQDALARGSLFEFPFSPLCRHDGAAAAPPAPPPAAAAAADAAAADAAAAGSVAWPFPSTQEERHRYVVFRDLHARGFRITGGSKFGADFLLYPGDPTLYHAQFCVRLAPADRPIVPALLAAACRGSFQARKHLLLASVVEGGEGGGSGGGGERVLYTTCGPVEGFG